MRADRVRVGAVIEDTIFGPCEVLGITTEREECTCHPRCTHEMTSYYFDIGEIEGVPVSLIFAEFEEVRVAEKRE